jgi:signal peptidase II
MAISADPAVAKPRPAVAKSRGLRWAMAGITVAVLIADQVTKSLVVAGRIPDGSSLGWLSVRVVRNHGASGDILSGSPILVTFVALVITALAAAFAVRVSGRGTALCLAAVLGGALGNLADRVFRSPGLGRGGVVDWIHLSFAGGGSLDLADLAIQFGALGAIAAMLIAGSARKDGKDRHPHPRLAQAGPVERNILGLPRGRGNRSQSIEADGSANGST